jgi:hypothetical protein
MGERFWGVFFQNFLKKFFANKKAVFLTVISEKDGG